ncbi:PKD domain-containing protein [Nonomuraea angiospora]|uniref:PKD domain-containing protein n=1 Tax=Nonomuraea angiospora TaxID=46172 RepID=UPI00344DED3C
MPLVPKPKLEAAGWTVGPTHAGTPPPEWPATFGVPTGTFDEGYDPGAVGFRVRQLRVFLDGNPGTDFTFEIVTPTGLNLGVVTLAKKGWSPYVVLPAAAGGDLTGIWTIVVDRAVGSSTAAPGLFPQLPGQGNAVNEPYVSPYGDRFEGILGVEFDGEEIPPAQCWDDVAVQAPAPVPCAPPGGTAPITCTASVAPAAPPYPRGYEWRVTSGGAVVVPWTAGSAMFAANLGAGSYLIAARVRQPDCPQGDLFGAVAVVVPDCDPPCGVRVTGPPSIPCVGGSPTPSQRFDAVTTPPSTSMLTWEVRDTVTGGVLTSTTSSNAFLYAFPQPGIFTVTASLATPGCPNPTAADSVVVRVPSCTCPLVPGDVTVSPVSACEWQLSVAVTPPGMPMAVSYHWTFGDGSSETTSTPSVNHTYASDGTFPVSVTVRATGCADAVAQGAVTVNGCVPGGAPMPASSCTVTTGTGTGTIAVTFDQPVSPASATDPANYSVVVAGGTPVTPTPGSVTYDPSTRTATISGLTVNPGDGVSVRVSAVMGANGVAMPAPVTSTCSAPGPGPGPGGSSGPVSLCTALLVTAMVLLLIGSIVTVIGVCTNVPWVIVVGAVVGGLGAVLFALWAFLCARFTPCSAMTFVHCVLFWIVTVIGPIVTIIAGLVGGLPCGVAAAAAWGGWGTIYAVLGKVMRGVGCTPTC